MKIENLKQLDKLMLMCRKRGIQSITVDGVTFHMSDLAPEMKTVFAGYNTLANTTNTVSPGGITADTKITTDELTDEQKMFWSSDSDPSFGQGPQ